MTEWGCARVTVGYAGVTGMGCVRVMERGVGVAEAGAWVRLGWAPVAGGDLLILR